MREEIIGKKYGELEIKYTFWQAVKNNISLLIKILGMLIVIFLIGGVISYFLTNSIRIFLDPEIIGLLGVILAISFIMYLIECFNLSFHIVIDDDIFRIRRWGIIKKIPVTDLRMIYRSFDYTDTEDGRHSIFYVRIKYKCNILRSIKIPYYLEENIFFGFKYRIEGDIKQMNKLIDFFYTKGDLASSKNIKGYKLFTDKKIEDYKEEVIEELKEESKHREEEENREWNQIMVYLWLVILILAIISIGTYVKSKL